MFLKENEECLQTLKAKRGVVEVDGNVLAPHVWPQRLSFSRLVYGVLFIHCSRCFFRHADNPLLPRRGTMKTSRDPTSIATLSVPRFPRGVAGLNAGDWTIMEPLHG